MKFVEASSYEDLSRSGAERVLDLVREEPDLLICIATGGSPERMYRLVAEDAALKPGRMDHVRLIALDEWHGLTPDHPATCAAYIQKQVAGPWGIRDDHVTLFDAGAPDPGAECERIADWLRRNGPIDLCVLGLGCNGHLGLNEPGVERTTVTHVAELAETSQHHAMLTSTGAEATQGMTLGMAEVMDAKHVLLLVTGKGKAEAFCALRQKSDPTQWPANFLWDHDDVLCIVDGSS